MMRTVKRWLVDRICTCDLLTPSRANWRSRAGFRHAEPALPSAPPRRCAPLVASTSMALLNHPTSCVSVLKESFTSASLGRMDALAFPCAAGWAGPSRS